MREVRVRRLARRRQLFAAVAIVALTVALLPLSGMAGAPAKVDVCHLNGVSDAIPTFEPATDPRLFYPGQVITVAAAAVPGHTAHGDSVDYRIDPGGLAAIRESAENNGLTVWEHADCFITRSS